MKQEEYCNKIGQIIVKSWADEGFKQRLLKDPAAVLKEEGLVIPQGLDLRVVENTDSVFYLVLPKPPLHSDELSEEEMGKAAGGVAHPCSGHTRIGLKRV